MLREQVSAPAVRAGLSSEEETITVGTDIRQNAIIKYTREMQQKERGKEGGKREAEGDRVYLRTRRESETPGDNPLMLQV